jgi:hypothetical protein
MVLAGGVLMVMFSAAGVEPQEATRNILLIGWDGCQRNHLKECIARGEVPNLMSVAKEGKLVAIDVLRTTDTKAGWTQILTGYEPETSGVFSNGIYRPIPVGYTVFERLEKFFGPDTIATVAVIGKKGHVDADPPVKIPMEKILARERRAVAAGKAKPKRQPGGSIVEENGNQYWVVPGKPYFNTKDQLDVFINGLQQNEAVLSKALEYLEKYKNKRMFFFIHFAEPDHVGHAHGEDSKEYTGGIISDDECTGKILAKLKELGLYDKTLVYITADHGFDEGGKGHRDAPYVFLATNDRAVVRRGFRTDITPTILKRFGVDLTKIDPPLDGRPLTESYTPPLW